MNQIRVEKLIFMPKAILTLAFCLFINGISIGIFVAYSKKINVNDLFIMFYYSLFIPYILLYKTIKSNIITVK